MCLGVGIFGVFLGGLCISRGAGEPLGPRAEGTVVGSSIVHGRRRTEVSGLVLPLWITLDFRVTGGNGTETPPNASQHVPSATHGSVPVTNGTFALIG